MALENVMHTINTHTHKHTHTHTLSCIGIHTLVDSIVQAHEHRVALPLAPASDGPELVAPR